MARNRAVSYMGPGGVEVREIDYRRWNCATGQESTQPTSGARVVLAAATSAQLLGEHQSRIASM
ncbi:MAG TPA: hypothetical protein VJ625_06865 [Propionibacteriaceae bacterium]|nr:hypothetical protein [Propionibacteriaceae bacterium]